MQKSVHIVHDPRPDLAYDTVEWTQLLSIARHMNRMAGGVLHGFRCGGARLNRTGYGYQMQPDIDPTGRLAKWRNMDEYQTDRHQWLVPHTELIKKAIDRLNQANARSG